MSPLQILLLVPAGVLAGIVSTVAGLASLVSYPALLLMGLPPVAANVTNTISLVANGTGAVISSGRELRNRGRDLAKLLPGATVAERDQILRRLHAIAARLSGAVVMRAAQWRNFAQELLGLVLAERRLEGLFGATTDHATAWFYLDDNRSWSIDERRLNFQFGTEVAWEVKKGRKGRLLQGFSYGGVTPKFWGSVEAVAGPDEYKAFGMPCGKGEPKQWGFLGHGAAPTLVRDVAIGVAG